MEHPTHLHRLLKRASMPHTAITLDPSSSLSFSMAPCRPRRDEGGPISEPVVSQHATCEHPYGTTAGHIARQLITHHDNVALTGACQHRQHHQHYAMPARRTVIVTESDKTFPLMSVRFITSTGRRCCPISRSDFHAFKCTISRFGHLLLCRGATLRSLISPFITCEHEAVCLATTHPAQAHQPLVGSRMPCSSQQPFTRTHGDTDKCVSSHPTTLADLHLVGCVPTLVVLSLSMASSVCLILQDSLATSRAYLSSLEKSLVRTPHLTGFTRCRP